MDRDETPKLVNFPAVTGGAVCGACGSPRQAGSFCRSCAYELVHLALALDPEEDQTGRVEAVPEDGLRRPTVPLRYGHYEVCRSGSGEPWELGRGAMGVTYKALDTHLGRHAALKVINARHLGGAGARDRFLHEARIAAQLRHPNIAGVFHLGPDAEDCFYAMEYIEGETLEARVQRKGALSCRLALKIVLQAARGLQAAHARHFIHRDIKPTNIMLMDDPHGSPEDPVVKLIDFGLVKTVTETTPGGGWCRGYFVGTPHYASPEQLQDGTVDARSDIYSLGRCLEYMLLGCSPGHEAGEAELEDRPLRSGPSMPGQGSGIPDAVAALLAATVAAAPADRPQCADELVSRVAECLATMGVDEETAPTTTGATTAGRRDAGRRAWQWSLVVAGLFCLAAIWLAAAKRTPVRQGFSNPPPASPKSSVSPESRALFVQGKEQFRKRTYADNQSAIKSFSEAIALSPSYAEAHANLASAYYENVGRFGAPAQQLDLAVASAERAVAADPTLPDAYQVLGAVRNLQGQPWEALLQLHRALELNPQAPLAMSDFSLLWVCVGRPDLALPWAEATTRIEPAKVQGWHAAAEASVELCMDEQAERFYRRCLELRPGWIPAHCGLIHLHLLQGKFALARQDFAEANSVQPEAICSLTLEAQVALFDGEYTEAEKVYRQLITKKRDGYVRYYSGISYLSALGFLRLQAGDMAEGNALLREAESLHQANSEGPEDMYDLAAIRAVQDRQEEALALLERAIEAGWNDHRATRFDPRFTKLRQQPRFNLMLKNLSARVATMRVRAEKLSQQPLSLSNYPVNPVQRNDAK